MVCLTFDRVLLLGVTISLLSLVASKTGRAAE